MKRLPPQFRYPLLFALYFGVFFFLDFVPLLQRHLVTPWTDLLAAISGALLSLVHPHIVVAKNMIIDGATNVGVTILSGCNAVEACGLLVAAMLSFPTRWRERLAGAVIGTFAVQAVNLLRIVSLFFLAGWDQTAFEFAHRYVWQALIMLDVLIAWLVWVGHLARRGLILRATEPESAS